MGLNSCPVLAAQVDGEPPAAAAAFEEGGREKSDLALHIPSL